jgi:lipid-A-disaccharide synthase
MRYFLIAGEASGDLHGSDLVKQLKLTDKDAVISCWGGDLMEQEGATLLKHYRELAVMGFTEVLFKLRTILGFMKQVKREIIEFKPDVVIMIDYPGFNLRIASFLKEKGFKVYYYISPKVWAWKESRVKKIKKVVERMYVIFPFETEFYRNHNYKVLYFGNPLVDSVSKGIADAVTPEEFRTNNGFDSRPIIALLPGSRVQEIKKMLPLMMMVRDTYRDYQFVVSGVKSVPSDLYSSLIADYDIKVVYNQPYAVLKVAEVALVTSGTATLETALAGVPQVVCYKTSWLTYHLAKVVLKIRFISLVNLIMDKEIVRELVQNDLNERNLSGEIDILLPGGWKREVMQSGYRDLSAMLDGKGSGEKVAKDIFSSLILVNNRN